MISGLDHININTKRLEETRRFFVDILGFDVGPRPDFGVPGYWLRRGGTDIVHLLEIGDGREGVLGALDHFAFRVSDHQAMKAHLERHDIPYMLFEMPDGSRKSLTIKDPNGVTIELNWRAP